MLSRDGERRAGQAGCEQIHLRQIGRIMDIHVCTDDFPMRTVQSQRCTAISVVIDEKFMGETCLLQTDRLAPRPRAKLD